MFAKAYSIYYMKKRHLNMSLSPAPQEQCDELFLSSAMTSQTPSWWWSPCLLGNLPMNIETSWGQVMCTEKQKHILMTIQYMCVIVPVSQKPFLIPRGSQPRS